MSDDKGQVGGVLAMCVHVCVCVRASPVFWWTVSSTLDLLPGRFWSVCVTSHLRITNTLIKCFARYSKLRMRIQKFLT